MISMVSDQFAPLFKLSRANQHKTVIKKVKYMTFLKKLENIIKISLNKVLRG